MNTFTDISWVLALINGTDSVLFKVKMRPKKDLNLNITIQALYVWRNIESCSCKHCCNGKPKVLLILSVFSSIYVPSMQCACAIFSSVTCPTVLLFPTLSPKRQFSKPKKNVIEPKCVFWCSLELLPENISHSKINWERYGKRSILVFMYSSVSQTFFKWGPLSLVRMFYGPPYAWDYQTH